MKYFPLIMILVLFGCESTKEKKASVPQLPNVIYILADDLGYGDLSFLGQTKFETPNIDRLASNGMVFTQHYAGATVCAPSRSALLSGMHTGHTPIRGNKEIMPEGQHPMPDSTFTMAEMFKQSGYVTSVFGKWGLGFPGSEGVPTNQGFDEFYGYNCQRVAHNYYPYHLWDGDTKVLLEGNREKASGAYAPDLIHDRALEFIEENKDSSFFMFYASALPHAELLIDSVYMAPFIGKLLPEKEYKGYDEGPDYRYGPYGSQVNSHAAFAAMVTRLDQQVGEIVSKVDELGLLDNTIIVFTSDNGPHMEGGADPIYFDSNGPYKGFKRDLYEGGIHVPMIVSWKGNITAGSSSDHVSAFWDVMPTFADLLSVELPTSIDGISFLPTLKGSAEQPQHDYLYWEFHEKGGRQAIRKGHWKAVLYEVKKGERKMELYDLSVDKGEENDLAPENPEIISEMKNLMSSARTESEVFRFASSTYLEEK